MSLWIKCGFTGYMSTTPGALGERSKEVQWVLRTEICGVQREKGIYYPQR